MARQKNDGRGRMGGRKPGSVSKHIKEAEERARRGITPLDYALSVMHDENAGMPFRLDACKAAIPYLHARRAPEDAKGRTVPPCIYTHPSLEDDGSDTDKK